MTERSNNWSITINLKNMTVERADEYIQLARQKGWICNGQLEQGELGTQHYQLHVKTPQVRFSAVKRAFPTAHIEVARNVKALATYVQKTETRIGTLPEPDEKYMTASKLWDMIYNSFNIPDDKDGWNTMNESEVEFYHDSDEKELNRDPLQWLDKQCSQLIRNGYNIDQLIVNPAIRSFWKKFYKDILFRSRNTMREAKDRQTDRQEETFAQSVSIPTSDEDPDEQGETEQDISSQDSQEDADSSADADGSTEGTSESDSE